MRDKNLEQLPPAEKPSKSYHRAQTPSNYNTAPRLNKFQFSEMQPDRTQMSKMSDFDKLRMGSNRSQQGTRPKFANQRDVGRFHETL